MVDLSTTYLGLALKNPLVVAASPLSKNVKTVQQLEKAGASALVIYSLFEEQIEYESQALEKFINVTTDLSNEASSYFPDLGHYNTGPQGYLKHITRLKNAVRIPVIASLNGSTAGGWVDYARQIEAAGADALELNLYAVYTSALQSGAEIEEAQLATVRAIRAAIHIPLAVKIGPFYSSLPNFAQRLIMAGANGLVLFNRFYQPDLDVETLEVVPSLDLSSSADLRLPLRWVAILYGRLRADLALTSGVHSSVDVVKAMMAGASVTMIASELIDRGVERLVSLHDGLIGWMEEYEYASIEQMRGSMSQRSVADPTAFERANYMRVLISRELQA